MRLFASGKFSVATAEFEFAAPLRLLFAALKAPTQGASKLSQRVCPLNGSPSLPTAAAVEPAGAASIQTFQSFICCILYSPQADGCSLSMGGAVNAISNFSVDRTENR